LVLAQTHGLNWQAPANDAVVARSAEQPTSASATANAATVFKTVAIAATDHHRRKTERCANHVFGSPHPL
jgi:hypothetical protein